MYNAYEKDIAIVNIFFGESTVFGEEIRSKNQKFVKLILLSNFQRLKGHERLLVV